MLFAVDLDLLAGVLAEQDRVAFLDVEREALAVILLLAGADGDDFAFAVSGMMIPPTFCSPSSIRWTMMRS